MPNLVKLFTLTAFGCVMAGALPLVSEAQEHHEHHACGEGETCAIDFIDDTEEVPFGTYSYRHQYLHSLGVIDRLLSATKESCCDGGEGGECRATELSPDGRHFKHGDAWCPLSPGQVVMTNVGLPSDVQAVVCAPYAEPNVCPEATYCVAASLSG